MKVERNRERAGEEFWTARESRGAAAGGQVEKEQRKETREKEKKKKRAEREFGRLKRRIRGRRLRKIK